MPTFWATLVCSEIFSDIIWLFGVGIIVAARPWHNKEKQAKALPT
jgi:hypothetical protein